MGNNNTTLYGSIGYTYLTNKNNINNNDINVDILLLSDMHSQLPYCGDYIKISDWFRRKKNNTNILLEEVPRDETFKLQELFGDADHTKSLKELYLSEPETIHGLDIRPYLIPFSWELIDVTDADTDITLYEYLQLIDDFFNFSHDKIKGYLGETYIFEYIQDKKLKIHFDNIKQIYYDFKLANKNEKMSVIKSTNEDVLNTINDHLDNIMEYFIISKIYLLKNNNKNVIIHAGLMHSNKVLTILLGLYGYDITDKQGINTIDNLDDNNTVTGCLPVSESSENI